LSIDFVCQLDEYDECSNINRLRKEEANNLVEKWTNDDDPTLEKELVT
jgi:hypothetical protein